MAEQRTPPMLDPDALKAAQDLMARDGFNRAVISKAITAYLAAANPSGEMVELTEEQKREAADAIFNHVWNKHCYSISRVSGGQKLIRSLLPEIINALLAAGYRITAPKEEL